MTLTLKDLRKACDTTADAYLTHQNEAECEFWFDNLITSPEDRLQDLNLEYEQIKELLSGAGYYLAGTDPQSWEIQVQSHGNMLFSEIEDKYPTESDLNRDFENLDGLLKWLREQIEVMDPSIDEVGFVGDTQGFLNVDGAEEVIRILVQEEG